MRVFLDANVLFTAAHNPRGKAAFVIELGAAGYFLLFTSDAAREEAERNLAAKYPDSLPLLPALLGRITLVTADPAALFPMVSLPTMPSSSRRQSPAAPLISSPEIFTILGL